MSQIKDQNYCEDLFSYKRNKTIEVKVGNIKIGGDNPIRIQSMTTTDTNDTVGTAEQAIKIINAGGELVRITAQGQREARNLKNIKKIIRDKGYDTPLVADIHFNANAALIAAESIEKVRINPGNFTGDAKKFDLEKYSDKMFENELDRMKEKIVPFLDVCKKHNTAIRIGTNHGSLSDRIMSRYGDTPEGMVEACMEYLRICEENKFHDIILSIKSSNTRIMVHTVRLLNATMKKENMHYPLHLGVTEAGSEDEGRIKSAVGSGALLVDGLGDTLRVSLTEAPENEIPVAEKLVKHISKRKGHKKISPVESHLYSPFEYNRRKTTQILNIGGDKTAVVIVKGNYAETASAGCINKPDFILTDELPEKTALTSIPAIVPFEIWAEQKLSGSYPYLKFNSIKNTVPSGTELFLLVTYDDAGDELYSFLKEHPKTILILEPENINRPVEQRAFILYLMNKGISNPVIIAGEYDEDDKENFQIISAADTGILFLDGLADGLMLGNKGSVSTAKVIDTAFGILQASRARFSSTEFISCPGCGRTLFELEEITREIKARTKHLKGLKIGIMGCIVNGIGEMADADYGYVGAGPGNVSLFRNRELIKKNVPNNQAVDELIALIKDYGDWTDPV